MRIRYIILAICLAFILIGVLGYQRLGAFILGKSAYYIDKSGERVDGNVGPWFAEFAENAGSPGDEKYLRALRRADGGSIPAMYYSYFRVSEGLVLFHGNSRSGYFNVKGEMIVEGDFFPLYPFSEGLAVVGVGIGMAFGEGRGNIKWNSQSQREHASIYKGKYGYINKAGDFELPAIYDSASSFSEGLAVVTVEDKLVFIDKSGNIVLNAEYDYLELFSEGLAAVGILPGDGQNTSGFINKQGEYEILLPENWFVEGSFSEGLAPVMNGRGKIAYIDKSGAPVIETDFDEGWEFSEGLAAVRSGDKWGFIDKAGELVIPCTFPYIEASFRDGVAVVMREWALW